MALAQQTLLIADGTEAFRTDLANSLQDRFTVFCCQDGAAAKEFVKNHQPDIIVLDLMLSELDGISFLYRVAESGLRPRVLATTRLDTPYIVETAQRLGVDYLIKKPCAPQTVAERVQDLARFLHPKICEYTDPSLLTNELMVSLGCPPKLRGFPQLQEAIVLAAQNEDAPVTKLIYPTIANRFKTTPVQVERAIRNVIAAAWENRDTAAWQQYFPPEQKDGRRRPSNGTFITCLASEVRRKNGLESHRL